MRSGIPAILWNRDPAVQASDLEKELQPWNAAANVGDLPDTLVRMRRHALTSGRARHPFSQLTLLWDDHDNPPSVDHTWQSPPMRL